MGALLDQAVDQSVIATSNPAAGAEISYTVAAGTKLALLSAAVILVASADVANRTVRMTIDDGTTVLYTGVCGTAQTAGQTVTYVFGTSGSGLIVGATIAQVPVASFPVLLLPGWRIKTVTTNIQAADDYGIMSLVAVTL